ncbi:MarR family winged helix-turn-helix transcriptional regulator, partial [Cutibacterium avidum]
MTEDRTVWLDDHQQRVWRLWLEVTTALPAVLNRQLSRDSQLSVQDFEVLVRLSETDDEEMRVVALSEHMGWERSRLSHHLTRMEKRGLIERRICCSDGRGAIIHLTDQGRTALQ